MAIAWGFKTFTLAVDSLTVVNWMTNVIGKRSRVRTKGAAEMLVKRRLGVISDTIAEYGLAVSVRFVSTIENKADRMTILSDRITDHPQPTLYKHLCSTFCSYSAALVNDIRHPIHYCE